MFRLPDEIKKGLEDYKRSLTQLKNTEITEARFKGIRVPWGIYSHRGGKVFMTRVRIPAGILTAEQLKALALASEQYGDGSLHITTRQDIQIHNVKIEETGALMDYLKTYELSPRGGGGNTVRNIIACPYAGICKEEVFDVRAEAIGLSEYLLRQESSFNLPRKFKIAFSGCPRDCAGCLVNDIGLLAVKKGDNLGFRFFIGGGMGAESRVGRLLEEFCPVERLGYCVVAVKNVFYKRGDRRNKHHNRLRFLIEDIGFDEFSRLYREELHSISQSEYIALRPMDFRKEEKEKDDTSVPDVEDTEYDSEYKEFLRFSVREQRQRGFVSVEIRLPRGDINSQSAIRLSELKQEFPNITFRTTQNQNICLCWVHTKELYAIFQRLKGIFDTFLYPQTLLDVVVCKGSMTCNLGLCNSPGLSVELERLIKEEFIGNRVFARLNIKLNGCPNACGQHPVGMLSLHGLVRRVDNRPVPFYKVFIGGLKAGEKTQLARPIGLVPARNLPGYIRRLLQAFEQQLSDDLDVYEFLCDRGMRIASELLKEFMFVPSYNEDNTFYIDWGRKEEFSLAGLGPGECGAGVLDMIDSDLQDAGISLEEAERQKLNPLFIKKALFLSARALLVVKGCDPKGPEEAFMDFKERFIEEGHIETSYLDVDKVYEMLDHSMDQERLKESFNYARNFYTEIKNLYKSMDSSFNFPKRAEMDIPTQKTPKSKIAELRQHLLDLKGTPCPINYVKTKLYLENLSSGDIVEVLLDEGEPIENVPKSLQNDGHQILSVEKQDGYYKVVVRKK